jgi:hypothetical protein
MADCITVPQPPAFLTVKGYTAEERDRLQAALKEIAGEVFALPPHAKIEVLSFEAGREIADSFAEGIREANDASA